MEPLHSFIYQDFLRELSHYDPECRPQFHLLTIRSFCLRLPEIIKELTTNDIDDLRAILIDWLEEDQNRPEEFRLLKGGNILVEKPEQFRSNHSVFSDSVKYIEKAYYKRQKEPKLSSKTKTRSLNQPCPICRWHHEEDIFTAFSSGDGKVSISVDENSTPHTALKVLHEYMEQHNGQYMPKKEWEKINSANPYEIFRCQGKKAWGMIECHGANVRIAPPNEYCIEKRKKKFRHPAVKHAVKKR